MSIKIEGLKGVNDGFPNIACWVCHLPNTFLMLLIMVGRISS